MDNHQTSESPGNSAGPQFRKVILPPKLARRGRKPILPRVFTVPEAAAILRLNRSSIYDLLRSGRLQGFKVTGLVGRGGPWRTTDLAILAFMGFTSPGYPGQKQGAPIVPSEKKRAASRANIKKSPEGGRRKSMGRTLVLREYGSEIPAGGDTAEGACTGGNRAECGGS